MGQPQPAVGQGQLIVQQPQPKPVAAAESKPGDDPLAQKIPEPSPVAIKRLQREFDALSNSKDQSAIMAPTLVNGDLFHWEVKLRFLDPTTSIGRDLAKYTQDRCVVVRMRFQYSHPFDPPRVRIRSPRFLVGSSNVLGGGAICVDTFSQSGWSPALSAEKCLYAIQSLLLAPNLSPRLDPVNHAVEYTEAEWLQSFKHIQRAHSDWEQ